MAALPKDYGDLSPYEIARLQNIQANKQKLVELGLSAVVPKKPAKKQLSPDEVAEKARHKRKKQTLAKKERAKRQKLLAAPSTGRRRSSRLAGVAVQEKQARSSGEEEEEGKDDAIHYDRMPVEAHHLDDFEFEVYTAVRTWRLHRKRELDIEPYKICQNRTICELIRRRRNNADFACPSSASRTEDLLLCWGIGPSKADGYGVEMIEILDEWESTIQQSRQLSS